jgi:hypothetical protein
MRKEAKSLLALMLAAMMVFIAACSGNRGKQYPGSKRRERCSSKTGSGYTEGEVLW